MIQRRGLWLLLALPLVVAAGATPSQDVDALLRLGTAAFQRGDLTAASTCFEQAQKRATDPGLVAFNLATVKYHQALAGRTEALAEAETGFRCCLESDDPRRAEALLGLGNCLLLRGATGKLDSLALRSAIDRFLLCQRQSGVSPSVAANARHNQERARLLLLQAAPPPPEATEDGTGSDEAKKDDPPDTPTGSKPTPRSTLPVPDPDRPLQPGPGTEKEQDTNTGEGKQAPGRGALPPVPDSADAPPISGQDASMHLERAWRRIHEDWIAHRRTRARQAAPGTLDW